LQGASWRGWRILLIAAAGEELTGDERIEFKRLTARDREPGKLVKELVAIFGRRAGKSLAMPVFDCWVAALCDHRDVLAPGEVGLALLISRDQRIAKIILNYIDGILRGSEVLASMIANRTADTIELSNGISIEVRPANYKTLRGPTYVCIVCDEIAHWFTSVDFANPDVEILASVRPGLLTTRGPLLMVSSVYAKHGELHDAFKKYYGPNGPDDILVAFGTSRDLNPSLPQAEIDRALEKDPVRNRAEYLSEWRTDTEGFIPRTIVEACIGDFIELPPQPGINYCCFIDPASGVPEGDSYAMAVSAMVGDRVCVSALRDVRPPFSPAEVVSSVLIPLCRAYNITDVTGDNYAGEFAKEPVRAAGIGYRLADRHKSELYNDPFLSLLNSRKIDLPRNERAINQICSLERSVQRSGRDQISHPTHGHDDIANVIAGSAYIARSFAGYDRTYKAFAWDYVDPDGPPQPVTAAQQASQRAADILRASVPWWWL
jgi:hypothetical protein